jgi:transposase-like protein
MRRRGQPPSVMVEHEGRSVLVADLAREHGLDYATLRYRQKRGLTGAALVAPPDVRFAQPKADRSPEARKAKRARAAQLVGEGKTSKVISAEVGISIATITKIRRLLRVEVRTYPAAPVASVAKPSPAMRAAGSAEPFVYKHLSPADLAAIRGRKRALTWNGHE